nr:peptidyl-prolyl cis-trans isomerase FKBP2-like isoform X2 [Onthophagus taurus]
MRLKYFVLILFVVILSNCASCEKDKKRLQIGIKHRPKTCNEKSKKGDLLHVHYKVTYDNGTEFDNSYIRQIPFTFTIGSGQVIKGWDQECVLVN